MGESRANHQYGRLDDAVLDQMLIAFQLNFTAYCNAIGGYIRDAGFDREELSSAFRRLDQRDHYYRSFHNMPRGLNEIKACAIFCFWLLKYRPLYIEFRDRDEKEKVDGPEKTAYDDARAYFSERFCIYLMNDISWRFRGQGLWVHPIYLDEFAYNLRNADISKEALIMIFEALIPVY